MAERRRGTKHVDLWRGLSLVFEKLGSDQGCPELGLPPLGSFLWSNKAVADIVGCDVSNSFLLQSIRVLAFTVDQSVRRTVDYKNLGSEELGSIYESLLELHPEINSEHGTFKLQTASGHERKTTGSYYTPSSLINCLLDSALDPVVDERLGDARRIANGQWRTEDEKQHAYSGISRSRSVAAGDGSGRAGLSADKGISKRGDVRSDQPDSQGRLFDSSEHRGGMGSSGKQGVSAIPSRGPGQSPGSGDPSSAQPKSGTLHAAADSTTAGHSDDPQQTAPQPQPKPPTPEQLETLWNQTPLATRHLLLAEHALLSMRVCDPACGSGHFLIAAAHRMAKRLAAIRTGDEEPAPEAVRTALRDVIGHCIYGVDINPMAVELCKVSLWMESLEPGKPLSFLDHRILCGNSLLGTTPALLAKGIPDEAFKPIEGDDKAYCSEYKKRNKEERKGQEFFEFADADQPWNRLGNLAASMAQLDAIKDDSIEGIKRKQKAYEQAVASQGYLFNRLLADAWCAAFVWKKKKSDELPYPITERVFRDIEKNPHSAPKWMREEVKRLAEQYQFFHWHLAFPDVFRLPEREAPPETMQTGWNAGFSVILGNPPWDKLQPEEQKYFSVSCPAIATASTGANRKTLIAKLESEDATLFGSWMHYKRSVDGTSHFLKTSKSLPLTTHGNLNMYRLFAELASIVIADSGRAGMVLQTGLATDQASSAFLNSLLSHNQLVKFHDFENRSRFFADVDTRFRFALVTISGRDPKSAGSCQFGWLLQSMDDLKAGDRLVTMTGTELLLFNPNSATAPTFTSTRDFILNRQLYISGHHLNAQSARLGQIGFQGEIYNMTRDSAAFITEASIADDLVPLYEAKSIHQFDHRYGSATNGTVDDVPSGKKEDSSFFISTRFYVTEADALSRIRRQGIQAGWLVGFRSISSGTNERTVMYSALPLAGVGNSINVVLGLTPRQYLALLANGNSFIFDYTCRQKMSGMNVNIWIMEQLPVIPESKYNQPFLTSCLLQVWIERRLLELTFTAWDLEDFAKDCGYDGPPFIWDEGRRFLMRCELDAAYFHLYLGTEAEWKETGSKELVEYFPTPRHAVDYILETFPIVKKKDIKRTQKKNENGEIVEEGRYITKDTILEIYDAMAEAIHTGAPYQTRLNPPPGPPTDAEGNFIPLEKWDPNNWPKHIHKSKEVEV